MKRQLSQLKGLESKLVLSLKNRTGGKFLSALALFLLMGATTFAQTAYVAAPAVNGTSSLNRGPNGSVDFQRTAAIYRGSELVGFPSGQDITSIGFSIATAANAAATGTIKIYMVNTTDATFIRSTTWADLISTPSAMTLVYDGPLTIPATAGFYNIALTTPFAYTGGNFYLAYEWNAITKSTGSAVYNANASLPASLKTEVGATAPATLAQSSDFRPVLNIGYNPPPIDAEVKAVFTMGKLAVASGAPHAVQAVIRNAGSTPLTNITVSLNVVGVNTFTNTQTVTIPPQTDTLVTFDPYIAINTGNNNVTVSVSVTGDANSSNDTRTRSQRVTANTMGYADYSATPIALTTALRTVGTPTTATNGMIVSRFAATTAVTVQKVRVYIPGDAFNPIVNNTGQTVYAIILNSAGTEVARSADKVLAASDLDKFVEFNITTPSTPTFTNEEFFVGLAVPTNSSTAIFYAVGAQRDAAVRRGTFYNVAISGTAAPVDRADDYVPMIELDVTSSISGTKAELNNAVAVYPNPSNGNFKIQFSNEIASAKAVEIRNINGQLVFSGSANAAAESMNVNVKNLAAGVYILQVKSDSQLAVKRLVIE